MFTGKPEPMDVSPAEEPGTSKASDSKKSKPSPFDEPQALALFALLDQ